MFRQNGRTVKDSFVAITASGGTEERNSVNG
jgi:hypothetical protein